MNKTRTIVLATIIAFAGASQASAGGLLGLGILGGNKTGGIVIAPSVGVGDVLSNNKNNTVLSGVLNGNLNGTLSGILNGADIGILSGSDCGCKKRKH